MTAVGRRPGARYITKLPKGEACVGMTVFRGTVLVATTNGIYRLVGKTLRRVMFQC
jgi:hypothetical protein